MNPSSNLLLGTVAGGDVSAVETSGGGMGEEAVVSSRFVARILITATPQRTAL
jgi:hypothetical protein